VTRLRQFTRGVSFSWLATLAAIVYSLLSVPVALRFLTVEEFGLLVLLLQVAGYFTLVEIGMSAATARILVDYKDNPDNGIYGSVILTSFCVFAVQAVIVLFCGISLAPWIVSLIGVPTGLGDVATLLLWWLTATSALQIAFRVYGSILYANKHLDLIHAFNAGSMILALSVMVGILSMGGGLSDLGWLFLAQAASGILPPLVACHQLGLLPRRGCWGRPSKARFREVFGFGKDIFLVNVGNQVLEASQLIIVTRTMGLTAAAVWSVSTKLFGLVYQLVTKISGTAIVFFAEMIVRGEEHTLATRFRQIYQLTAGTAVLALGVAVAINQPFVSVWANPALAWPLTLSCLLAVSIFFNAITRCSGDFIIHTKNIAAFRYVYFLEAAMFVLLSLWLSARIGFYGILGASLLCLLVFRASYTTWRMAEYFQLRAITFWWIWLKRPVLAGIVLLPFVISSSWLASNFSNLWGQLFVAVAWVGLPAIIALVFVAIPRDVRKELALRWPQLSFLGAK
jgi:O-antigen/teichoic acid export membrane protein